MRLYNIHKNVIHHPIVTDETAKCQFIKLSNINRKRNIIINHRSIADYIGKKFPQQERIQTRKSVQ